MRKLTGGLGMLGKQRKLRFVQGRARFKNANSLEIEEKSGNETLEFEHAILATGSSPAKLPHVELESPKLWDSTNALELKRVPKSLLVVGGGYIGLEMATLYAALGAEVTVVEMRPNLLPGADSDLSNILASRVKKICKDVLLETKVASIEEEGEGLKVRLEGKDLADPERYFNTVLVSVGRKPNTAGLGLENTTVKLDEKGFVMIDAHRRSAEKSIFAIGDAAGEPMLAHKASHEGFVAAETIAGKDSRMPRAIPGVVFTDPEVAWVGLTEESAREEKVDVEVVRFPWAASGRAISLNRTDGSTKLVLEPGSGKILGVGIVGPGAGDLISEGVLAVEKGLTAADLQHCVHPHPTLSETLMEAAEIFAGTATHIYRPKRRPTSAAS